MRHRKCAWHFKSSCQHEFSSPQKKVHYFVAKPKSAFRLTFANESEVSLQSGVKPSLRERDECPLSSVWTHHLVNKLDHCLIFTTSLAYCRFSGLLSVGSLITRPPSYAPPNINRFLGRWNLREIIVKETETSMLCEESNMFYT